MKAIITRTDDGYLVQTDVYMSDHTYQGGRCTLQDGVLRFPGEMNRLPFRITLGPVSRPVVEAMTPGQSITLGQ